MCECVSLTADSHCTADNMRSLRHSHVCICVSFCCLSVILCLLTHCVCVSLCLCVSVSLCLCLCRCDSVSRCPLPVSVRAAAMSDAERASREKASVAKARLVESMQQRKRAGDGIRARRAQLNEKLKERMPHSQRMLRCPPQPCFSHPPRAVPVPHAQRS